jgi:hypothetical protein
MLAPLPDDPLAAEYAPPRASEVGTTAGQLRIFALGGGAIGKGASIAGQGTLELMTIPWIGVRASSLLTLPVGDDPQFWSFRLGPSLHFLPYHVVDVSLFFDGGPAFVDLTTSKSTIMPSLGAGASLSIALSSYFVLHFEALAQVGIADRGGAANRYAQGVGLAGLGLTL